jgi:DNA polymerase III subunit delta
VPAIDLATLKKHVADRRLAPVYVLVGEDVKLVDRMVDALEGTIDPADRPFAVDRVYAGEASGSPVNIVSSAQVLPMLGDRRIVIVLRAERLLKPKRVGKAAEDVDEDEAEEPTADAPDLAPLEDYLDGPVDHAVLVFVATDMDRSRRLTKKLLAKATIVEFAGLAADGFAARREGRRTAQEWLQEELTRSGRAVEPEAARLLVTRAGHDITKLRGDVERLLLFTEGRKRITTDDVMEVVADDQTVDDDWAVINAIADGDPARALVETGRRFDRGDSPHQLLGQLRWWVSSRLAEGDASRVKPAVDALLRTDLALKSSGGEERVLLERLVVELTGRRLAASRGWR